MKQLFKTMALALGILLAGAAETKALTHYMEFRATGFHGLSLRRDLGFSLRRNYVLGRTLHMGAGLSYRTAPWGNQFSILYTPAIVLTKKNDWLFVLDAETHLGFAAYRTGGPEPGNSAYFAYDLAVKLNVKRQLRKTRHLSASAGFSYAICPAYQNQIGAPNRDYPSFVLELGYGVFREK